jgi:hypothetical protein
MTQQPDVLTLTSQISVYMKTHFQSLTRENAPPVTCPDDWDVFLFIDCQRAVKIIWQASQNIGNFMTHSKTSLFDPPAVYSQNRMGYRSI